MKCLDLGGGGGDSPDLGYDSWYYQTCTEFVMPFCADGKQDMFMPVKYDFPDYSKQCQAQFGTVPREFWPQFYFSVDAMRVSKCIHKEGFDYEKGNLNMKFAEKS